MFSKNKIPTPVIGRAQVKGRPSQGPIVFLGSKFSHYTYCSLKYSYMCTLANHLKNDDYTHLYMVDSQFISESTSGYTDGPALHYVFAMSGESYANDDFDVPYDMLRVPYGITGLKIKNNFSHFSQ